MRFVWYYDIVLCTGTDKRIFANIGSNRRLECFYRNAVQLRLLGFVSRFHLLYS